MKIHCLQIFMKIRQLVQTLWEWGRPKDITTQQTYVIKHGENPKMWPNKISSI
jgi:hypothetical protein